MKILVFNDTHLTHRFDRELFDYIVKLVKSADQVIINGDFWDAYLTTFDQFCNSKWKALFPLLKNRNTVYVFGNHDKQEFMDSRYSLFSTQQVEKYEFKSGNKSFFVTHGHSISPAYDRFELLKDPVIIRNVYTKLTFFVRLPFIKTIFTFFENRVDKGHLLEIKEYVRQNRKTNQIFIVGHSHIPEFNLEEKLISIAPLQPHHKSYCFITNGELEFYSKGSVR